MKVVKTWGLPSQSRGIKTTQSQCRGHGLDPWLGNYDPACHMAWPKKKKERKVPACLDFSVEQRETDNKQKYIEPVTPHITVMAMEWGRGDAGNRMVGSGHCDFSRMVGEGLSGKET